MIRRLDKLWRDPLFLSSEAMEPHYDPLSTRVTSGMRIVADFVGSVAQIDGSCFDMIPFVTHSWLRIGAGFLACAVFSRPVFRQTAPQAERGPYARIAIMRAIDGHSIEWEEGYIRHLEWHRRAQDPFKWYSYAVWASSERQRWIVYATFGHSATSLSNPILPAEDERDSLTHVLPHARFLGNGIYEYLPALSRGNAVGVPTPTLLAEYTTVDLARGSETAFETALAAEQPKLKGETLWYRLVVGGDIPCYVRLRPRGTLAAILDERAAQALPEKANGLISKMTVETLNLRPNMLVNVSPEPIEP